MHDLIGLRDEDLTDDERRERDALLASDPEAREEQCFADELGLALASWAEEEGGPTRLPEPEPARWWRGGALALAAVLVGAVGLVVWLPDDEAGRWKGGASTAQVQLQAIAEGAGGLRPVADGGLVGVDERVVFRVQVDRPGLVSLEESGGAVVIAAARRGAGTHVPGGEQPASWRPDTPVPEASYTARWCDEDVPSRCVSDELRLRWEEAR